MPISNKFTNLEMKKRELQKVEFIEIEGDPDSPYVMLFHGYGANYEDLLPLSEIISFGQMKPHFFFPQGTLDVPIAPGYIGKGWFNLDIELIKSAMQEKRSEDVAEAFPQNFSNILAQCQNLIEELNIPLSKLFIGGFSQGAILATEIALNSREKMGGLLLFSAMLVHEKRWRQLAKNFRGMPFFQSHGKHDSLLPFDRARALESLLLESGFKGKLHAFSGGHEIPHSILLQLNLFLKTLL
jgi:phospholipase/carboxylesterase